MAHPGLPVTAALMAVPVAVLLFVLALALLGRRRPAAEEPPPALPAPRPVLALPAASGDEAPAGFPYVAGEWN